MERVFDSFGADLVEIFGHVELAGREADARTSGSRWRYRAFGETMFLPRTVLESRTLIRTDPEASMSRPFIVVGDATDHGGTVITGAPTSITGGKSVARIDDEVMCARPECIARGMGTNRIVTGDPTVLVDGRPVARHGDKTACGATLVAGQLATTVGSSGGQKAAASDARQDDSALQMIAVGHSTDDPTPSRVDLDAPNMDAFDISIGPQGQPVYTTRSEADAMKLARRYLQIPDGQAIAPDQVLNTNPGEHAMTGELDKQESIVVEDSRSAKWARFADGRGLGDGPAMTDMDAAQPAARPQFSRPSATMGAVGAFNDGMEKWKKADDLGKRQQIDIYSKSRTGRRFVHIDDYRLNIGGNELERIPVSKDEAMFRIDNLGSVAK